MSTNLTTLMEELIAKWKTNTTLDRHWIHLFSGKNLAGGVIGKAIECGIHDWRYSAYSLTQHVSSGGDYTTSFFGKPS